MFRIKFPWLIAELVLLLVNYCHSFWSACSRFSFRKSFLKYDPIILFCIQFSNMTWEADVQFLPLLIWYSLFSSLCIFLNIIKYLFSSAVLVFLHHHCCSSVYLFLPQQEVEKLSRSIKLFAFQKNCFTAYGKSNQWLLPFIRFTCVA